MTSESLKWFNDQAKLFHRDQRLKNASPKRNGTETSPRKELADINDTDEPTGTEDWGPRGAIIKKERPPS